MAGRFEAEENQNESYFISFNDLLIGIIFLFIIILLAYSLNFRAAEESAARELAELQDERDQLKKEKEELRIQTEAIAEISRDLLRREEWRDELLRELATQLASRGIDVVVDLEKGVVRLPESLLFASGSAALTEPGQNALSVLANVMQRVVPCYVENAVVPCERIKKPVVETVLIEGHTDNVPIRGGAYRNNWELSAARGVNTYNALIENGPMLDGMTNEQGEAILGVSGYEARRPVASNATAADRERNRRIDLRFLIAVPKAQELRELDSRFEELR